jgi:tetratricopeptide (TPR) repeat protein
MEITSSELATALAHYSAGRIDEARQICQRIVAADANSVDAWQMLGVIAYQAGDYDAAIANLRRALALKPNNADLYYNLGNALKGAGRLDEAVARYRQVLQLRPDYPEAHNNLGNVLHDQGHIGEAIACYRRAIELKPAHAGAHFNLGNALRRLNRLNDAAACYVRTLELNPLDADVHHILGRVLVDVGRYDEAIGSFNRALELKPNCAEFHDSLGLALQRLGKNDAAIGCHRRAIELDPSNSDAHNNLGNALENQQNTVEAVACYRTAIELKPDFSMAHSNLGIALRELGEVGEAIGCLRQAVELSPDSAQILSNLATALWDGGFIDEAIDCFRRAMQLNPELTAVRVNHAYLTLLTGDFQNGWREFEWRFTAGDIVARQFQQAQWKGQPLHGKTILLHAEQGLGDTIQFVRYGPLVKRLGGTVVVECQKPLVKLLATTAGIDRLIGCGDELPSFDFQIPLLSMPGIFRSELETIPANTPYLFTDPELCEYWRNRLSSVEGFRIGINWHGRAGRRESLRRDIPMTFFASLANLPGVSLISLQQNAGRDQWQQTMGSLPIVHPGDDFDTAHGAFMDTAAIMMNVDLVITSDTSVAHVAGALGVPVWVALPFMPNWRWLLDRTDNPWYPTMRLFRQSSPGDWEGVMAEVGNALKNVLQ